MHQNRDDFTDKTRELLARRAGWRCSNPFCRALTCGAADAADAAVSVGVAAHICAAAPGGKRYDPTMTRETRRHITNGIWLCQTCSRLIDCDERRYPVSLLQDWKKRAEKETVLELERGRQQKQEIPLAQRIRSLVQAVGSCEGYEAAMECLGKMQAEMDALVERLEGLQEKVDLAGRNGDFQWERIYRAQFDHTLYLFEQLNMDARDLQQQVRWLRSRTEDLSRNASGDAMPAYLVIDTSGSMDGGISAPAVGSGFAARAGELLERLQHGWQRAAALEEALDGLFGTIRRMELMDLEVEEAIAASVRK